MLPGIHDYITDGESLWRVEYYLPDEEGVCLEDARTTTTRQVPMKEFRERWELELYVVDLEQEAVASSR